MLIFWAHAKWAHVHDFSFVCLYVGLFVRLFVCLCFYALLFEHIKQNLEKLGQTATVNHCVFVGNQGMQGMTTGWR